MSNAQQRICDQCGAPLDGAVSTCKFCGAELAATMQAPTPQYMSQQAPPQYTQPPQYAPPANPSNKSKTTAGILAIFLGGIGAHKFYLGKKGMGILYILFCWTYIPAIVGLIEGIIYLTSNDNTFYEKYVMKK